MTEDDVQVGRRYRQIPSAMHPYRYNRDDVIVTLFQKDDFNNIVEGYYIGDPTRASVWWWMSSFLKYYIPVVRANEIWKNLNEH